MIRQSFTTWIAIVTLALISTGCAKFCAKKEVAPAPTTTPQPEVKTPNYSGITVRSVVVREMGKGKGKEVQPGDTVSVKYTEYVYDPAALGNMGPKIYDTAGATIDLTIGEGRVIKGLESGIVGMSVGGKRQLIIPSSEAYGEAGRPPGIPPKAMVMIDIELTAIK